MTNLRSAFRTLARTPGLSLVIIGSLALGLGANTVVFSWLKSALLNPLPGVGAPVWLVETKDDTGNYTGTSWLEFRDLGELLPSFDGVAAQRLRELSLGEPGSGLRVYTELVSANFFSVLGLQPALGRFFRADETVQPGNSPVAVIGHDLWQRQFGGEPGVLGRELKLNGRSFTVVGVAPAGFRGGMNHLAFEVYVPMTMAVELVPGTSELRNRDNRPYTMLARLKPGVTPARARGELAAAAQHLLRAHPETNRGLAFALLPVWQSPRGGQMVVTSLATLQAFGLLILLVVCANTANLLLARASTRRREIGVRLAIGAGAPRILGQLLLESVGLALAGAAAGLLVALWGVDGLARIPLPGNLPLRLVPEIDWSSAAFTSALGVVCGVIFGLAPALQLARGDILDSLRGGHGSIGGTNRLRDALVGLEVGVALVVLMLAGLFIKSFAQARTASPGFDAGRVMLLSLDLGGRGYTRQSITPFLSDLTQRLAALPGVEQAAASNFVPLDLHGTSTGVISVEGQAFDPNRKILYSHVSPGFFAALGIPLAGEDLAPLARGDLPPDAVIGDEMARRYWPGEDPVGRRFEVDGTTYVIKGVARTPQLEHVGEAPQPAAWLSLRTRFVAFPALLVRSERGDPRDLLPAIRETVRRLDPALPMLDTRTLAQHVENNLFRQRVPAAMLAVLGPLALALAASGLYAVIAYAVAQRTQEIGVRLTLGATPRSVVGLVMWQSFRVVLLGAAAGWGAALVAGWYLRTFFVRVPFGDPWIYAGVPALLLAVAALASFLPARRAAGVNPVEALRTN